MTSERFGFALLLSAMSACVGSHNVNDPSPRDRSVQILSPGTYMVSYSEFDVIDDYGPGVESVRAAVRQAREPQDKARLWEHAAIGAVPKYLEARGLVPVACKQGIVVMRCGSTEGGGGWAEFRCK